MLLDYDRLVNETGPQSTPGQRPPEALLVVLDALAHDDWDDADPGDLVTRIDPACPLTAVDHATLDGQPHVTVEMLDRLAADAMPISSWEARA